MKCRLLALITWFAMVGIYPCSVSAQPATIQLPAPQKSGGATLLQALAQRRSQRSFAAKPLSPQMLSNLLWAAAGVNRPDGRRTAPTAVNWKEIDIYLLKSDGVFRFQAAGHQLIPVMSRDVRALAGKQAFTASAPLNLVYVADYRKMDGQEKDFYAATDTGFVSQNVYLYCASAGLATVVLGYIDRSALHQALQLDPQQKVILSQSVGFPQ